VRFFIAFFCGIVSIPHPSTALCRNGQREAGYTSFHYFPDFVEIVHYR
jgi:hypothetical protein